MCPEWSSCRLFELYSTCHCSSGSLLCNRMLKAVTCSGSFRGVASCIRACRTAKSVGRSDKLLTAHVTARAALAADSPTHGKGCSAQAVAKDPPAEEVERAKMAAVSAILINLESRAVANEDIGRQILTYGHRRAHALSFAAVRASCLCAAVPERATDSILPAARRKPIKEFTDLIRGVKPSDISSLVSKMVKTPLSLACLGDIAAVPRYNAVQSHFG